MNAARLTLETLRLNGSADSERQRARWMSADTRPLATLVEFEGCERWLWRNLTELGVDASRVSPFLDWLDGRARAILAHNLLVDAQPSASLSCCARTRFRSS